MVAARAVSRAGGRVLGPLFSDDSPRNTAIQIEEEMNIAMYCFDRYVIDVSGSGIIDT